MDIFKGAGHTVLPADAGNAQRFFGSKSAEERRKRFAPAMGILFEFFEIFLQCQAGGTVISAHGHKTGHTVQNGVEAAVEGTPMGNDGIKTVGHQRGGGGFPFSHRQMRRHPFGRRHLIAAAEGHQNRCCPDGAVKHFTQPLLRGNIGIESHGDEAFGKAAAVAELAQSRKRILRLRR